MLWSSLKRMIRWLPPTGKAVRDSIDWGGLRRLQPISRVFGLDRGQPIDRYYIEGFLNRHKADIHGSVLEIGDPTYTRQFGEDRVLRSDVLLAEPGHPGQTLVGDLATGQGIPESAFDCIILTQTLPFIYDMVLAVGNTYRALRPGGVLLATLPGISQISRYDMDRWGDYWRFTDASTRRLFAGIFDPQRLEVEIHGNVLAAVAFLHGLAVAEMKPDELDYKDPDYQLIITVRAVKEERGK
jgi:SAM-dependent methyltransferase